MTKPDSAASPACVDMPNMPLHFTKMNGAGNDFVVINNTSLSIELDRDTIARLCDRHRGVGADGLLTVEPPRQGADFRMRYYNSDGGEAEMCGNGARCFARFAARLAGNDASTISFETEAGLIKASLEGELVSLDMGQPVDQRPVQKLFLGGELHEVHFINTGVPHAVSYVADLEKIDIRSVGSALRWHEAFSPKGTNANFAQAMTNGVLLLRTFERGVEDETLACGTGVCAAAILYAAYQNLPSPVHVTVRGGDTMRVDFSRNDNGSFTAVRLTGPADFVFEGEISL